MSMWVWILPLAGLNTYMAGRGRGSHDALHDQLHACSDLWPLLLPIDRLCPLPAQPLLLRAPVKMSLGLHHLAVGSRAAGVKSISMVPA